MSEIPREVLASRRVYEGRIRDLFAHGDTAQWSSADQLGAVRVAGMSCGHEENREDALWRRMRGLYAGLSGTGTEIDFCVTGSGHRISYCFGAPRSASRGYITGVLKGSLEDPDCLLLPSLPAVSRGYPFSGCVTGMPSLPKEGAPWANPMNVIAQGMLGYDFTLLFRCFPRSGQDLEKRLGRLNGFRDEAEGSLTFTRPADIHHAMSQTYNVSVTERYRDYVKELIRHAEDARTAGFFAVSVWYGAADEEAYRRLKALIPAAYGGENAGPDPVCCADLPRGSGPDRLPYTELSGSQTAALCMLPDRELPGFYVNEPASFDRTLRREADGGIALGRILRSPYQVEEMDEYLFSVPDFDRHALIVGATGGGKTNTVKSILSTLYGKKGIPFMVIESAKSEYWQLSALKGFGSLAVYPLGRADCAFALNPFECAEGFPLQTHVDSLLSTFNASFEMYAPMPFLLEQAIYKVYGACGWDIATGRNRYGKGALWPTLTDLNEEISRTVARSAYDQEIKNNVTGALQTRIRSLMIGGKGKMMDVRQSTDFRRLMDTPVVMELENLGDDDTKAFVMGLLMNRLYEFRRTGMADGAISKPFSHLLIIEEAHRLLKNVDAGAQGNQSRAASVEFFCNMLSEIRSYGQGIMIADQSPTKLARDAIRNTNLKIVHRIVDGEDREAVGSAMHMREDQIEALSILRRGAAAVYSEGDMRPFLVKFPLVEPQGQPDRASSLRSAGRLAASAELPRGVSPACLMCPHGQSGACGDDALRRSAERTAEICLSDKARTANMRRILSEDGLNGGNLFEFIEYAEAGAAGKPYSPDAELTADWPAERILCLGGLIAAGVTDSDQAATALLIDLRGLLEGRR